MRVWPAIGVVLFSATAILVTDLAFRSTLLHTLWPVVVSPAESAAVSAPVVVRWEGPQPLRVILVGDGKRIDLGPSFSPMEVAQTYFRRSGVYGLEVQSPILGNWFATQRRFVVHLPESADHHPPAATADRPAETDDFHEALTSLADERDRLTEENSSLASQIDELKKDNGELQEKLDDLGEARAQADERAATLEAAQTELLAQHRSALEENQLLRARIASVPNCTTWGYVAYPRPQMIPPTRRLIIVSTADAQMFRSYADCEVTRQNDGTAASVCFCVASPWQGSGGP